MVAVIHIALLLTIMYVALPKFREVNHNTFEKVARFGNWTSLIFFWYQASHLIIANQGGSNLFFEFARAPEIWALSYLTFCVAQPWLRLKRIPVRTVTPSGHVAISEFNYGVTPFLVTNFSHIMI